MNIFSRLTNRAARRNDAHGNHRHPDMEAVLSAFYRVLFLREPDFAGLMFHLDALNNGATSIEKILASFVESEEFKRLYPNVPTPETAQARRRFVNDHTQFGEFEALLQAMVTTLSVHRIVVDVGAHGATGSNSYDLMREFGWRGLLIEANSALNETIHSEFSGLDYTLVNTAISDFDGRAALHFGANEGVSSLNRDSAEIWGSVTSSVEVEVRRLGPLLEQHNIPADFDLLSLDIEGEDMKVLNDLIGNSRYRPRWVIVEAEGCLNAQTLEAVGASAAVQSAYTIVGRTMANLILKGTWV